MTRYQAELDYCLAQAAELLDGRALPVSLDWDLERSLEKLLTLEARQGLGREPAVLWFDRSKRGHHLAIGMERYRWETPEGPLRIARVVVPCGECPLDNFWAVRVADYRRFYRAVRRDIRRRECEGPPILPESERRRLWDNTVGFLHGGQAEMSRYGVPAKRGVLLLGEPGNGKTMACRWLAAQCRRNGLEWKTVTAEMYEDARLERQVPALFRLPSPGIVLFDDFDAALRDRQTLGETEKHATFLAELDGVRQKTGIVYLFASNAAIAEVDPAMRRPGRIDVIVPFPRPDAGLRRRLVRERWHPDLVAGVDVDSLVADTEGFSFAELEEAKKLLVMRHLETSRWDWPWVHAAMLDREKDHRLPGPIGFRPGCNGHRACGSRPVRP